MPIDVSFGSAFRRELSKTAATIEQLQAVYRRLRPIRTNARPFVGAPSVPPFVAMTRPAVQGPQMLQTVGQARQSGRMVRRAFANPALSATIAQTYGVENTPAALASVRDLFQGFAASELAAARNSVGSGRLFMPRGGATKAFVNRDRFVRRLAGSPDAALSRSGPLSATPRLSAPAQRFTNVSAGLHEGFERRVPTRQVDGSFRAAFGHQSPRVLLNEHNAAVRATGAGAAEHAGFLRNLRTQVGDLPHVERNMVVPVFGERGLAYAQQHGYTPAMKRILNRRMVGGLNNSVSSMDPQWAAKTGGP